MDVGELKAENARLRAEIAAQEQLARQREREMERYLQHLRGAMSREQRNARKLAESYDATVRALANAVAARDEYTGNHAERVAAYGLQLAMALDHRLADDPQLEFGFLLHDVGKVAVPDAVLHKGSALTPEEERLIRRHPVVGWQMLRHIDFLEHAVDVVLHHHERWDGDGYPARLKGEEIPIAARVFSVADALDAITTDRPYRKAEPLEAAREIIEGQAGTQFDPQVVEALASISDDVLERIRTETRARGRSVERVRASTPSVGLSAA
jgi:ribonuclease P protein subunit RPR2